MKNTEMTKKGLYIGTGAGIVIFALTGLLPGSFIGGAIGVSIAAKLFGDPLGVSLLPKLLVLISMLVGVLAAGLLIIVGTSSLGWLIGYGIDATMHRASVEKKAAVDSKWKNSVS